MAVRVNNNYDCYVAISTKRKLLGDNISKGIKSSNHWKKNTSRYATSRRQNRSYCLPWNLVSDQMSVHICTWRITVISSIHMQFFLILSPFNSLPYFLSIINLSSLLLPSKSFFSLVVSFHYTGCCGTWMLGWSLQSALSSLFCSQWGAGFNTVALVCCSHLVCCDKAECLRGISRQHQLQHFHMLLFLFLFLDLPFHLVVPLYDLPDPFQTNSLSIIGAF